MFKMKSFLSVRAGLTQRAHVLIVSVAASALILSAGATHADPLPVLPTPLAPSSASPATAPSAVAPLTSTYVIAPADQLTVLVLGHDDLRSDVTVLPDGSFTVPVAGTVHAAGLTIAQLTQSLVKAYSFEMNQPQVSVIIRQTVPQQVSILGTVKLPGQVAYRPGMHILEALAAAGGPNQDTAQTQVTLISVSAGTSQKIGGRTLLGDGAANANTLLQPGDVLLVEQADPASTQVQVSGEVGHPGFYAVPTTGATLQAVLNDAGGTNPGAALTHIQVQHEAVLRELSVLATGYSSATGADVLVYPGDTVRVPANERKVAVIGEVHTPGAFAIPDGSTLTVTAAIILAGGTTTEADKMRANILRRSADGHAKAIPVNVASILKGDPLAPDLVLQPGDILYLPTHSQRGVDASNLLSILPGFTYLLR